MTDRAKSATIAVWLDKVVISNDTRQILRYTMAPERTGTKLPLFQVAIAPWGGVCEKRFGDIAVLLPHETAAAWIENSLAGDMGITCFEKCGELEVKLYGTKAHGVLLDGKMLYVRVSDALRGTSSFSGYITYEED